jgi:subtilisin family serine protease
MDRTNRGHPGVQVALIDGFIDLGHITFLGSTVQQDGEGEPSEHATFIASILVGQDGSSLGIARGCSLLSLPVWSRPQSNAGDVRRLVADISAGIRRASQEGADIVLVSLDFDANVARQFEPVAQAIALARRRGAITVVSAGNGPAAGAGVVLSAPGAIPVASSASPAAGVVMALSPSVGTRGLQAPGAWIPGASVGGGHRRGSGSSYAAAVVAGAAALLKAAVPSASGAWIAQALLGLAPGRPRSIVPRRLDADRALRTLLEGRNASWTTS